MALPVQYTPLLNNALLRYRRRDLHRHRLPLTDYAQKNLIMKCLPLPFPQITIRFFLIGCLLLCIFFVGCYSNNENSEITQIRCGEGTLLQNGHCVLDDINCPEGKVPTPAGPCLAPDVFCGPDTQYDVELQSCTPLEVIVCGEGTVEVDGRCLTSGGLRCGPGTVLANGVCLLSEDVCGDDTELHQSQCSPTESTCQGRSVWDVVAQQCVHLDLVSCGEHTIELDNHCIAYHTFADELAAAADIDFSEDNVIELGSDIGDQFIFTGTLTESHSLFHPFTIEGSEGQWITITLYSRGLPSPGFRIRQIFGSWQRESVSGLSNAPSRTVVFPSSEHYDLIIQSSVSGLTPAGPFGDESWSYVGVVEIIEPPQPIYHHIQNQTITGDLNNQTANFIELDFDHAEQVLLIPELIGDHVQDGIIELWHSPLDYGQRFELKNDLAIPIDSPLPSSRIYLLFDAERLTGHLTDFHISLHETSTLDAHGVHAEEIVAQKNDVLFLSQRNADAANMLIHILFDGNVIYSQTILPDNRSFYSSTESRREFFYIPQDGTYTVEYENIFSEPLRGFYPDTRLENIPIFTIDPDEPSSFAQLFDAENISRGQWRFALLDAPAATALHGTVDVDNGRVDVSIFDTNRNQLHNFSNHSGTTHLFDFTLWSEGIYFLALRPFHTIHGSIDLQLETEPLSSLPPSAIYEQTFDVQTFDVLTGSISFVDGGAPDIRLLNANGEIVFEERSIPSHVELLELLPGSGEFTLQILNNTEYPTLGVHIDAEITSPFASLNLVHDFHQEMQRPRPLSPGDKDMIVLRAHEDLLLDFSAFFDEDQDGNQLIHAQLRNLNSHELLFEGQGPAPLTLSSPNVRTDLYLLEIEALSEITDGYDLQLTASRVHHQTVVASHDPDLIIVGSTNPDDVQVSPLAVDDCSEILDLSITVDFSDGFENSIHFSLHPPAWPQPLLLIDGQGGWDSSPIYTIPDPYVPVDSLDSLIGANGDGQWLLNIAYHSCCHDAHLNSWSLHMICLP